MSALPPVTPPGPTMDRDGVEIVERVTAYQGYFRIDRYTLRHRRYGGGWTPPFTREIFERGHAAAVLFYDPVADRVGLAEQFRMGAYAAGWPHPWLVEIVAGIIDPGETPAQTAVREGREEAGIDIVDMVPIVEVIASPGGSTETVQLFCARADASQLGGVYGMPEESEDIRIISLATDEAMAWIADGRIKNATTIIALQWLVLHRDELRRKWGASA